MLGVAMQFAADELGFILNDKQKSMKLFITFGYLSSNDNILVLESCM
eukprot:UN07217